MTSKSSTRALFDYWDTVRDGRRAPRRVEIEPAQIARLLPETFILERSSPSYRFRLAGTKLCQMFGRELRGRDFLELWTGADRIAFRALLQTVFEQAAVGRATFVGTRAGEHSERFDMCLLPLIYNGSAIDRLLGCITSNGRPSVFEDSPLTRVSTVETDIMRLDRASAEDPSVADAGLAHPAGPNVIRLARHRWRLVEGGLNPRD